MATEGEWPKIDGDVLYGSEVNNFGNFRATAQLAYECVSLISNTDYVGSDKFSDVNGAKNTVDTGKTTAFYDSDDDYYSLTDMSVFVDVNYYAIVEASIGPASDIDNGIVQFSVGKWIIFDPDCAGSSTELERAIVHEKMWGASGYMDNFTTITDFKISDSNDVGFRGYFINSSYSTSTSGAGYIIDGTFGTTSDNVVSSWSNVYAQCDSGGPAVTARWEVAEGTVLNTVTAANSTDSSYEIGTDKQSDEKTNPADCQISVTATSGITAKSAIVSAIIFTKGTLTWVDSSSKITSAKDYYTTYSVPETSQADTLSNEGVYTSGTYQALAIVETNTIINEIVPDSIVVYGKTDLPTDTSITVDVSDDGGSTWGLTDKELNTAIDTSSFTTGDLALKFNLATTDTSETPKLYGYGVVINQ